MTITEKYLIAVVVLMTLVSFACLILCGLHYRRTVVLRRFAEDPDLSGEPLVITEQDGDVYLQYLGGDDRFHIGTYNADDAA